MGRIAYLRPRKHQMDKLKIAVFGVISVLIICALCICGIGTSVTVAYAETSARVLYSGTPLTDGNGAVIAELSADTVVEITGTETEAGYPVTAGEQSGYIRKEYLYFADNGIDELKVASVKVRADGVGRKVELKIAPSPDAESVFVYMAISAVVLIPVALAMTDFSQPVNWSFNGPYLTFIVQILNAIGAFALVYANRYGKAMIVAPLADAVAPVITTIISLVLYAHIPTVPQIIGIVSAISCVLIFSRE